MKKGRLRALLLYPKTQHISEIRVMEKSTAIMLIMLILLVLPGVHMVADLYWSMSPYKDLLYKYDKNDNNLVTMLFLCVALVPFGYIWHLSRDTRLDFIDRLLQGLYDDMLRAEAPQEDWARYVQLHQRLERRHL